MSKLRRFMAWAALAAWLASSGLSWDLLQVVAWANMSRVNAASLSTQEAIKKTIRDKPCPLCLASQKGREASEQSPVSKSEFLKVKAKYNFAKDEGVVLPLPYLISAQYVCSPDVKPQQLSREVPVPPPKV
jgi:hypothetical protein